MVKSRRQTSHTYNGETANEITEAILDRYCMAFSQFSKCGLTGCRDRVVTGDGLWA